VLAILLAIPALGGGRYLVYLGTLIALQAALATSLNIVMGYAAFSWPGRPGPIVTVNQNVSFELSERALVVKYPAVYVYADRVQNLLIEKFRKFSGKVRTIAEVRVSQDRLEGIEEQLRLYVDAVTQVLDVNRGTWGEGAFFTGGYDVTIDPVRQGGRKFMQIAKVTFEVDISVS